MPRLTLLLPLAVVSLSACTTKGPTPMLTFPAAYTGTPFSDEKISAPQKIPGTILCAYYDIGGEGVAYHDTTPANQGSGALNPLDGSYLNEFRHTEAVDTSYTKYHNQVDDNPYNLVKPPDGLLYVGWTEPTEWFNLTVDVAETGTYTIDILYTSNRGGAISLDINQSPAAGPIHLPTTNNPADPIAWRQWHHWNILKSAVTVPLHQGKNLLTVHILTEGNMNLATLTFTKK